MESANLSKFRSKAIVTTSSKARIVEKLKNYWHVKSLMMQVRANPELLKDPSFQLQTMRYVQEHTELPALTFWKKLTTEAQMKACQYLIMHELAETNYFRIDPSKEKAAVYVVLSGTAEVKDSGESNESTYNVGDIFGSTELFDEATNSPNSFDFNNLPTHLTAKEHSKQVVMNKGTFMRLSLFDFHQNILKDPADEEQKMRDEAVKISGIRWEDLTDDDKFYVRVYQRTRQLINADLFAFLDAYKLVPKNARTAAYRYYREGIFGRELYLDPEEALSVYIVIDGSIRLEIEARRDDPEHNTHTLSCKRKGKKPMVIMTRTMPILLLESGSLLFPSTHCHTVGLADDGGSGYRHSHRNGATDDDTNSVGDMSMSTLGSTASHPLHTSSAAATKRASSPPRSNQANSRPGTHTNNASALYNTTTSSSHSSPIQQRNFSILAQPHTTSQGTPLPGHNAWGTSHHAGNNLENIFSAAENRRQSDVSIMSKFSEDYNTFVAKYTNKAHHQNKYGKRSEGKNQDKKPAVGLYKLRAIFERETTYLKIPFAHFERILDDNRLIVKNMADVIKKQLQRSNDTIVKRITSLLPWLDGKLTLRPSSSLGTVDEDAQPFIKEKLEGDESSSKKPVMGGKLMGSYGTNILSSSMGTMLGKNRVDNALRHSMSSTTIASSIDSQSATTAKSKPNQLSSNEIMKNLKEKMATKQCPPIFLTISAAGALASKGKRRAKRDSAKDSAGAASDDQASLTEANTNAGGGGDSVADEQAAHALSSKAMSSAPLPPLETVSEV